MSIAKIIGNFLNALFGRKKSKPEEQTIDLHVVEGLAFTQSKLPTSLIVDNGPEESDDDEDDEVRSEVCRRIKSMIKREDKGNPLFDAELVTRLETEGFTLSRRTVCNYRDRIGLISRNERKKNYEKEAKRRKKKSRGVDKLRKVLRNDPSDRDAAEELYSITGETQWLSPIAASYTDTYLKEGANGLSDGEIKFLARRFRDGFIESPDQQRIAGIVCATALAIFDDCN